MDVEKKRLKELMQGKDKEFIIPIYQRHYDWREANCKQLYKDLVQIAKNARHDDTITHFFGNIFASTQMKGASTRLYTIIDGQQRITSITLLYLAMYNFLNKEEVKTEEIEQLLDEIYNDILVEKYKHGKKHLTLGENDRDDFNHLFQKQNDNDIYQYRNPNICNNYKFFYEQLTRLNTAGISIKELFEAIARLDVVVICLDQQEKPQQIFESLNSTGLSLSPCDKIRNFVFMDMPNQQQERLYEQYWREIEAAVGSDIESLNEFFRDYLTVAHQRQPKGDEIYPEFQKYSLIINNHEELLADIYAYARLYRELQNYSNDSHNIEGIHGIVYRLGRLQMTTPRPLMLKLLRLRDEGVITEKEATEIFTVIETYIFRRIVCELPSNGLKDTFLSLLKELDDDNINLEKLKYKLIAKNGEDKSRFPSDKEFKKAFMERDFYSLGQKNVQYALERINNFDAYVPNHVWEGFDRNQIHGARYYTIEHIMPQTLNSEWKNDLGNDWETISAEWTHRIANLTITENNSGLRNKSFYRKKTEPHGYTDSGLRINNWIIERQQWGLAELEGRNKLLGEMSVAIWPMPTSTYTPNNKPLESYILSEDNANSLVGRKIQGFSYKEDSNNNVRNWATMYVEVLKILHEQDKSVLMNLASPDNQDGNTFGVSYNEDELTTPRLVDEDEHIYVSVNTSTPRKIELLLRFFKLYNADPSDLIFYLKDRQDNEAQADDEIDDDEE